jgi:3-methyladenine DNA glycosylase AlkD
MKSRQSFELTNKIILPMNHKEVLNRLHALANPEKVLYKEKKFGITTQNALGIYHQDLKIIAKDTGRDSDLALKLFASDIYEAKILCSKIFRVKDLNEKLMDQWVQSFDNWEICDSFCMALFAKSPFAITKAIEWSTNEHEFTKRAAFTTMASYCISDKKTKNQVFEDFLSIIERESLDERLYVKKAVNWALRNIGKRNADLRKSALKVARCLVEKSKRSTQWIGKNALSELEKPALRMSDYPRSIYR